MQVAAPSSLPLPPSRGAPSMGALAGWAGTPAGQAVIAQLRWQIPPLRVVFARLRAEAGAHCPRDDRRLRESVLWLGIPHLQDGQVSLGDCPLSWSEVRGGWQSRCQCPDVGSDAWLCPQCGGALAPAGHRVDASVAGTCRWCALPCETLCPVCQRGVHFQGSCSRWLRGASLQYARQDGEEWWLCPDCFGQFVAALQRGSVRWRQRTAGTAYVAIMDEMAVVTHPGAGSGRACIRRNWVSPARRFLLSFMERRGWLTIRRLATHFQEHREASGQSGSPRQFASAVRQAVLALVRERRVRRSPDGRSVPLCSRGRDPLASTRTRGRRRRRSASDADQERRSQRRRI